MAISFAPNGIITPTIAAHGGLPAGWARATGLDDYFPRGANAYGAGVPASTHIHAVVDHSHTKASHSHTTSLGSASSPGTIHGVPPAVIIARVELHTHSYVNTGATAPTSNTATVTLNATAMLPQYRIFQWAKSNGSGVMNSTDLMWMWADLLANATDGWAEHAWLAAARGRFMRGAPAATNPDAVTRGNATHTHTDAGNHFHTNIAHTHTIAGGNSGWHAASIITSIPAGAIVGMRDQHRHALSGLNISTDADPNSGATAVTIQAANNDPPHLQVNLLRSNNATRWIPGLLALWDGNLAAIPAQWRPCNGDRSAPDYRGLLLKVAVADGQAGSTGGSLGHTHIANTHGHTQAAHGHTMTGTCGTGGPTRNFDTGPAPPSRETPHTHPFVVATATSGYTNTVVTVSSADADWPKYRDVIVIEYSGGGAVNMLRVRPPDVWIARTPAVAFDSDHPIDLTDMDGGWNRIEHQPRSGLDADPTCKAAIIRVGGQIFTALIPQSPGAIHIGPLDWDRYREENEVVIAGDWIQVSMEIMPAGSMLVVLCLKEDGGNLRWFQSMGDWNQAAGSYTMIDPPVECDTDPGGDFQNALDACASLRRTPGGGLLFTFIDEDYDIRTFRCVKVEEDATGTWEEV